MGYQSLPGARGRIFVELSELVAVEVSRSGRVIEYKLVGARVPLRNNRNPLLLGDFRSSALSAVLVPDKQAVFAGDELLDPPDVSDRRESARKSGHRRRGRAGDDDVRALCPEQQPPIWEGAGHPDAAF